MSRIGCSGYEEMELVCEQQEDERLLWRGESHGRWIKVGHRNVLWFGQPSFRKLELGIKYRIQMRFQHRGIDLEDLLVRIHGRMNLTFRTRDDVSERPQCRLDL